MKSRLGILFGTLTALAILITLTGFQVGEYPAFKTPQAQKKKPSGRTYYKDLSDTEIRKVMKKMSAEIGAKCDYCHNTKDYASFEKEMKIFAHYKLGMVDWLNNKYRPAGASWEYSCYTCHRGKLKEIPSSMPLGAKPGR
ncbi:MAG: photosynthetic reaction center cytochrome c subunit family protein [Candidatus Eisenbacteria bacterium]|nr:photosynthetic reaction center cytochrome c subunit family protein [Candidatus Eisenbacteria bacterium]